MKHLAQGQVKSPGQVSWPSFIFLQPCHCYSSCRNLQDCLRSSVPIKFMPQNFYPHDLRSDQFLWPPHYEPFGKYENVSCFTWANQNHPILSGSWPLTPSVTIRVQLAVGGHREVQWGHSLFFDYKSWHDGDRDALMVPNDLTHWAATENVHVDLLGSWSHLDLTWPDLTQGQILKWTFQGQKVHSEPDQWCIHDAVIFIFISLIKKILLKTMSM